MSGEVNLQHGFLFDETSPDEIVTHGKLNKLVTELVAQIQSGSITNRELADGSITSDKLDVEVNSQLGVADGSVTTSKIVDEAVSNSKLADMLALSVKARPDNTLGMPEDLQAGADGDVLQRVGNELVFAPVTNPAILGDAVRSSVDDVKIQTARVTVDIDTVTEEGSYTHAFDEAFDSAPTVLLQFGNGDTQTMGVVDGGVVEIDAGGVTASQVDITVKALSGTTVAGNGSGDVKCYVYIIAIGVVS